MYTIFLRETMYCDVKVWGSPLGPRRQLDPRAGHDGGGYGHLAGALLSPVPAALRWDADVQPPTGLHRVAHHPGRPTWFRPFRLLSHRLQ